MSGAFNAGKPRRFSDFGDGLSNSSYFAEQLYCLESSLVEKHTDPAVIKAYPLRAAHGLLKSYIRGEEDLLCEEAAQLKRNGEFAKGAYFTPEIGWGNPSGNEYLYTHIGRPNDWRFSFPISGYGIQSPSSQHAGGVNVLFADGHVSYVTSEIDIKLWRSVGTINGQESLQLE